SRGSNWRISGMLGAPGAGAGVSSIRFAVGQDQDPGSIVVGTGTSTYKHRTLPRSVACSELNTKSPCGIRQRGRWEESLHCACKFGPPPHAERGASQWVALRLQVLHTRRPHRWRMGCLALASFPHAHAIESRTAI